MLYRVRFMSKADLRFIENEPQEMNYEQQKHLLNKAFYAVSTAACNAINQSRTTGGCTPVTESTARDIVLCWANK